MYLNEVKLIGHIGRVEARFMPSGDMVLNFTLATTKRWKKEGEYVDETLWHKIVVFRDLAKTMEPLLKKGMPVYVSGALKYGSYLKDGVKVPTVEIVADSIQLLSKKEESGGGHEQAPETSAEPTE